MPPFSKITSRDNQKLKFARSVRDGREPDHIFLEGFRLANEVASSNLLVPIVFFTSKFFEHNPDSKLLRYFQNAELFELDGKLFDSIADTKNSQGIIVIAERPRSGKEIVEQNLSAQPFLILLHKINNPSNLGAILRTAEAVGIDGVIATKGTTDVFSPKATRGAMGANLRLPIWSHADFSDAVVWAKSRGIVPVCADIGGPKSYLQANWKIPRILIVGSEAHGLSEVERAEVNESVAIPMENGVESLNVAVACGIIMFEAKRQKVIASKTD